MPSIPQPPVALATRDLSVRFGGHVAVNAVSCDFACATLTAIVGPNGAGKTTYFNLISGQIKASAGTVTLHGKALTGLPAAARTQAGIGRAFQLTQLFPALTVLENVRLVLQARARRGFDLLRIWSDHADLLAQAHAVLARIALAPKAALPAGVLSHGDQRKLEVGMLIALDPSVYMFDEPTAGMSIDDVPVVLDLIASLKQDKTKTILLVEHKMDVVRALADRIIVLHNGSLVADGEPERVIASDIVQQAYLGLAPTERCA